MDWLMYARNLVKCRLQLIPIGKSLVFQDCACREHQQGRLVRTKLDLGKEKLLFFDRVAFLLDLSPTAVIDRNPQRNQLCLVALELPLVRLFDPARVVLREVVLDLLPRHGVRRIQEVGNEVEEAFGAIHRGLVYAMGERRVNRLKPFSGRYCRPEESEFKNEATRLFSNINLEKQSKVLTWLVSEMYS